jgi:hypothetical protein
MQQANDQNERTPEVSAIGDGQKGSLFAWRKTGAEIVHVLIRLVKIKLLTCQIRILLMASEFYLNYILNNRLNLDLNVEISELRL